MVKNIDLENLSNKEIGYLIGLFIGDGYSTYSKKDRHYIVEFYLNSERDKNIISFLTKLLEKISLRYFAYKDKRSKTMRVKVNSKKLYLFVQNKIKELYNNWSQNYDFDIGLISGFIDAEGYIGNGEILLTQKDYVTIKLIKDICEKNEIETRKFWSADNYKSRNKIWRLRLSTSFKKAPHVSQKVAGWGKASL